MGSCFEEREERGDVVPHGFSRANVFLSVVLEVGRSRMLHPNVCVRQAILAKLLHPKELILQQVLKRSAYLRMV